MRNSMSSNEFLTDMITDGRVTVSAGELRNLLVEFRKNKAELKALQDKHEKLLLHAAGLKSDLESEQNKNIVVYGIDTHA